MASTADASDETVSDADGEAPAPETVGFDEGRCLDAYRLLQARTEAHWDELAPCFLAAADASELETCEAVGRATRAHLACLPLKDQPELQTRCIDWLREALVNAPSADADLKTCLAGGDAPSCLP